jgi:hypothetical protein
MPFHFGVACGCACQNVECDACNDDEGPRQLRVTVSGLGDNMSGCGCTALNKSYVLNYIGNCTWVNGLYLCDPPCDMVDGFWDCADPAEDGDISIIVQFTGSIVSQLDIRRESFTTLTFLYTGSETSPAACLDFEPIAIELAPAVGGGFPCDNTANPTLTIEPV